MADESRPVLPPSAAQEHYVYLYIDDRERVRYVGYGRETARATSHLARSHNEGLNRFLVEHKYRIEIAGPFEEEQTGRAVETALISALKPEFNIDPGQSRWRFRPLGVPSAFAERLVAPELTLSDFLTVQGSSLTAVLFVIVTDIDLDDRVGYNPADPPSEAQIRQRVDRWWQLQQFLPAWTANPETSPGLLVGVFGSPGRQTVIASARIDRSNWATAKLHPGGKLCVPLCEPLDLDAFGLRGRRIAKGGLMFGGIPAEFYILLHVDGVAVGGHHRRKAHAMPDNIVPNKPLQT